MHTPANAPAIPIKYFFIVSPPFLIPAEARFESESSAGSRPPRTTILQRSSMFQEGGMKCNGAFGSILHLDRSHSLGVHRLEEFRIALGVSQFVEQEIDGIHRPHRVEDAAQHVHLLEHIGWREQFFLAGARTGY